MICPHDCLVILSHPRHTSIVTGEGHRVHASPQPADWLLATLNSPRYTVAYEQIL